MRHTALAGLQIFALKDEHIRWTVFSLGVKNGGGEGRAAEQRSKAEEWLMD
jgi:hypothetical protein